MTQVQMKNRLQSRVAQAGTLRDFWKETGIPPTTVSEVISGNRLPGKNLLKVLGLERVVTYRKMGS